MIKFEEKEYDLNLLCNFTFDFQILKEVLLKLAKSNHKLEKKIKRLEKSNEEKNKRLLTVEDRLNILFIPEENVYSNSEASEEKIEQKDENKNIGEKKEEKEIKEEEKKEDKKEEEKKEETKKEEKKEEEKKEIYKEEYDEKIIKSKINLDRKKSLREFEYKNSFVQQAPQVSHETIKSLLKLIRENSEKISKLEKNISKKLNKNVKDLERDFYDFNEENTKQHESMKQRIKELNEKLYDYNYKMDGIIVKTAPLDNLSIFRDSGNGSIDATKGMIKLLEQKINKRIEIIEKKSYNDNKEDNNYKNKIEELEGLINKINDKIKNQEQNRNNNNFENIISNYNEDIQEIRDTIDKNYNEVLKLIDDISLKVENGDLVGDKLNEILSKIKTKEEIKIPKLEAESTNKKNIILERSNKDEEDFGDNISDIKERIKALNNKMNDIDSYFKSLFNNSGHDINEIKKNIGEINLIMEQKITKNDLKPLENKAIEQNDEIVFIQDKIAEIMEGFRKLSENNSSNVKRLEALTNDIIQLQNTEVKVVEAKPIDLSGYVEEKNLNELLKPIHKSLESLFLEKEILSNSIKETNESLIVYETKERVMKLEEELDEKLSDIQNELYKKYAEKFEVNKIIKNLELKLKSLDTQQNKEGDSWILAKQPIGCFNCASCEANIKNLSPSSDYILWNKYPQADRQYHMGQGFSRLLQKINNHNDKNKIDKKDLSSETELSSSLYFNNMPNIKGSNGHFLFRNNKEPIKENIIENNFKYNRNYKLPNVPNRKKIVENIPLTDEEEDRNNKSMDNNNNNSPQIMKIAKKKINGDLLKFKINHKKLMEEKGNIMNSTSVKTSGKLERNQSLPLYENVDK